jgi:protein-S-isoprenylcysteine O-methyltransferase Ste14
MPLIPVFRIGLWNAWIFMTVFLLQMLLIRFIDKDVYKKASNPADMKLNKREKILNIILSPLIYLSCIYTIFLPLKLNTPWFYVGLFIFILGLSILTIATVNFLTTPLNLPITKGIYHYSRHPIYFANFIIFFGTGIATASWIITIISVVFLILSNIYVIAEERFCIKKYGNYYLEYLEKTPKWIGIPKL